MILVDFNQVCISDLFASLGKHTNVTVEKDLLRHMILNSLRSYKQKFSDKYGELVICADHPRSWRKEVFPYYKANRAVDREKSEIDWKSVFKMLEEIREEIRDNFPYRVIIVEKAEADDVIATLCSHFGNTSEKILILSEDKDFKQLHSYLNVEQYAPIRKKRIECNDPEMYLKEHIMTGDRGDGVPNFLSNDDCLVLKTRQKKIMSKKLEVWKTLEPEDFCTDEMMRGYKRNEQLIDLNFIPINIAEEIINQYNLEGGKDRSKLFSYFVANKLKHLMTDIGTF